MNTFEMKTAIHFGDNALDRLKEIPYKRVLIITDPFVVQSKMINLITAPLNSAGIEYDFFPDVVGRRGGRCGSDGNAGTGDLSAAGFSWTDGETVSGDFAGCDEPAVFLPECFDGHHGDLWFLCKR